VALTICIRFPSPPATAVAPSSACMGVSLVW
jgi:hypothetical protein